ncbi:MAG: CHAT domain-containing protein [Caldilineaceae bacterium]
MSILNQLSNLGGPFCGLKISKWANMSTRAAKRDIEQVVLSASKTYLSSLDNAFRQAIKVDKRIQRQLKLCELYNHFASVSTFCDLVDEPVDNSIEKEDPFRMNWGGIVKRLITDAGQNQQYDQLAAIRAEIEGLRNEADAPRITEMCRQALTIINKETEPDAYVFFANRLGRSYLDTKTDNRKYNIQMAIAYLREAASIVEHLDMAYTQFHVLNNLALAYGDPSSNDQAQNIERALAYAQQILQLWRQMQPPYLAPDENQLEFRELQTYYHEQREFLLNSIGELYRRRHVDNRSENLERAIEAFEQALTEYTSLRRVWPNVPIDRFEVRLSWPTAMANLGITYIERIKGDHADNLEQAIEYLHEAKVLWRESKGYYVESGQFDVRGKRPSDLARMEYNLGAAYQQRVAGDLAQNLARAMHHLQDSAQIRTRETMPHDWAETQHGLAVVLGDSDFDRDSRSHNVERALEILHDIHDYYLDASAFAELARIKLSLGNLYGDPNQSEAMHNMEKGIAYHSQALDLIQPENDPATWVLLKHSLGKAYVNRLQGVPNDNQQQAIQHYSECLEVCTPATMPRWNQRVWADIGDVHFQNRSWAAALSAYGKAIEITEMLVNSAFSEPGKREQVGQTARIYTNAAYCLLQQGHYDQAFWQLEAGKTRILNEILSIDELSHLADADGQPIQQVRSTIRELTAEYRLSTDVPGRRSSRELSVLLEAAYKDLKELVAVVRSAYPETASQIVKTSDLYDMMPNGCAIMAPFFTTQGSAIFVATNQAEAIGVQNVIFLDEFTSDDLEALTVGTRHAPGWVRAYFEYLSKIQRSGVTDKQSIEGRELFFHVVDQITQRLWETFMRQIVAHLNRFKLDVSQIVFVLQGGLQALPLHAAWRFEENQRRYLIDDFEVAYAPSILAFLTAVRRSTLPHADTALIAGISDYPKPISPLHCAEPRGNLDWQVV